MYKVLVSILPIAKARILEARTVVDGCVGILSRVDHRYAGFTVSGDEVIHGD